VKGQLGLAEADGFEAGSAPKSAILLDALHSPPSPALPPSRRKGA
jgi:hypothetical protein